MSVRLSDDDPNSVRAKGINFITILEAVTRTYGAACRQRIERDAPGELGDALRFGAVVAGGWYKIAWCRTLWRLIVEELKLDDQGVRRLAQKATGIGVDVVYRSMANVTTIPALQSLAPRVFSQYFDKGELVVVSSEPCKIVGEWTRCQGFDAALWNQVIGGVTYFLESTGAKSIGVDVLDGAGDTSWMRASFTYR